MQKVCWRKRREGTERVPLAGDGNLNQGDGSGTWGRIMSPLGLCSRASGCVAEGTGRKFLKLGREVEVKDVF